MQILKNGSPVLLETVDVLSRDDVVTWIIRRSSVKCTGWRVTKAYWKYVEEPVGSTVCLKEKKTRLSLDLRCQQILVYAEIPWVS